MIILDVCLLLVFLTLGLAVGTVPVDQDHQRQHEHHVGNQNSVGYSCHRLRPDNKTDQKSRTYLKITLPVILWYHYPWIHDRIVTREGLAVHWKVWIFFSVNITVNVWWVSAPLDIDEERGVGDSVLHSCGLIGVRINLNNEKYFRNIQELDKWISGSVPFILIDDSWLVWTNIWTLTELAQMILFFEEEVFYISVDDEPTH